MSCLWFGMVSGGAGAVWIFTHHRNVVAFANNFEPEDLKRLDEAGFHERTITSGGTVYRIAF